jgi:tetratricopeptide (TPR) repeat protein
MSDSDSGADPLGPLADEFLERHRRGERPTLTEYAARHPELAEQIRELFAALLVMEDVRPGPPPAGDVPQTEGTPRRLGEYRIVREIGRGGMGIVYEAEQESLGRRVALKVLPPGALGDAAHVERFQREARAAARLHHTNIVPVFGVGEESGTHYYVMQYIEGRPLDEVLAELRRLRAEGARGAVLPVERTDAAAESPSAALVARSLWQGHSRAPSQPLLAEAELDATEPPGPPSPAPAPGAPRAQGPGSSAPLSDPHRPYANSVAHLGVQVAEALEYAAGQGVLHRDVKPSNLLLDVWGTVWLTDFGLAKATGTPDLTRPGDLLGTVRYMAPERFRGHADVRSDVYALGLTLYELLALRPAFGEAGRPELIGQITSAEPPRLDRLNPQLPRDLVTIVYKAMAKDPAQRYPTAAALAEDLRRFLDGRSILARRLSLPEQAWRLCRRHPSQAALAVALLAVVGLVAGGGVWLVREQAERQAEAERQEETLRREVGTALAQAAGFRKGLHFRQGRELLEQVKQRLAPAGPDDLRQRLEQAQADLDLAEHLDSAQLQATTLVEGKFDFAGAERRYVVVFAKAGLGREGEDIAATAAQVRDSALRAELVASLDDWASLTTVPARRNWLLAVAREADRDPERNLLRQPELWQDGARLTRVVQKVRVSELSPQFANALARVLNQRGGDAVPLLAAAQARFPNDFWLNLHLAGTLREHGQLDEALGYYRAALALRPKVSAVHNNFANALQAKGRLDDAIAHFRQAIQLDPKHALAHYNLGIALQAQGRLDEAIAEYRQSLRLQPDHAESHCNLGNALRAQGRLGEAIDHYQQALRLNPHDAKFHNNIGNALQTQGRLDKAIEHYQQALRLDPKSALAHNNLGNALVTENRLDEAISHYRQAIQLDPKSALAHNNLGNTLQAQGRLDEAIKHYQQALRLDPMYAAVHYNLGNALQAKGRLDEAIAEYRESLRLQPDHAESHCNLGLALQRQGQFADAIACLKRGHELGSKGPRWPYPSADWLKQAERLATLDNRLPAVLQGKDKPADAAEGLAFAQLCRIKKRYAAAARLHADAFADDAKLADDLGAAHRYNAACAAALAAAGQGADAEKLDDGERARLRRQALKWLTADLEAYARLIKGSPHDRVQAQTTLRRWQADGDLAGIRDALKLIRLPPEERERCRKLWAEVDALLQRSGPAK